MKLKISITTDEFEWPILGKLYIGPRIVFGYFFVISNNESIYAKFAAASFNVNPSLYTLKHEI